MNALILSLLVLLAATGCVSAPPATPAPAATSTFTGEVWLWDEQNSTVTLRQGTRFVRVKVSPDQMAGLRLHQTATVRGEVAPLEVEHRVLPPGALVARGPAIQGETAGTVRSIDPAGLVSIESPVGVNTVWIGTPGAEPFQTGQSVRVRVSIQPLDIVPTSAAAPEGARPAVGTEPGEYAVIRGRITAVDPTGRLTVASERGPVTVSVPAGGSYRVGDWVEVRTAVHPST